MTYWKHYSCIIWIYLKHNPNFQCLIKINYYLKVLDLGIKIKNKYQLLEVLK